MNSRIPVPVRSESNVSEGRQIFSLRSELDRVSERYARDLGNFTAFRSGEIIPRIEVSETDREMVFTARHADIEADDVEVVLADDLLTIGGEKPGRSDWNACECDERGFGSFSRCFEVPAGTQASAIDAFVENGMLTVKFPKAEAVDRRSETRAAA